MELRSSVVKLLQKVTKLSAKQIEEALEAPPTPDMGNLAFPCFILSKKLKKSPGEIAKDLRDKLAVPKEFQRIEVAGPYLNFFFDAGVYNKEILTKAGQDKYGRGETKEKILMDIFQSNPFKEFHVGHLRNAALGESLRRILEFNGAKTFCANFNGDVGIHIAKWLWYFNKFYKGKIPKTDVSKWAGEIYVKSVNKIAESEDKYMEEANEINRELDSRSPSIIPTWKKIRDLCYKDAGDIAKELGCKVDVRIPESEVEELGRKKVIELYSAGKIKKDQGALIIDLEKYGLGIFILLKKDGTALYATKDIGLFLKKSKLYNADKFVYVVGSEQDHHFRQLFKTFELLGLSKEANHKHVSYGLVRLKSGKMSSRKGNVISYTDLRNTLRKNAQASINERNPKMSQKEISKTAEKIATGAMMVGMLKQSNSKPVTFDMEEVLRFEGDTGPYLQYSLVRSDKILKKGGFRKNIKVDYSLLDSKQEKELIKSIAEFPEVAKQAAAQHQPSIIANYTLKLAHSFSRFYESSPVIQADPETKKARLALVSVYNKVLRTCLDLLAVPEVDQM